MGDATGSLRTPLLPIFIVVRCWLSSGHWGEAGWSQLSRCPAAGSVTALSSGQGPQSQCLQVGGDL